ncbi:hypothetical protein [Clostridium fungisolvens]|uniref:HEAT repeat domain-containing protein n=1 Tax=Clostridium fungisolvens TaxID=1604897 RepID=A0A6V8SMI3_9CLOT|nr:hypothetical protein [Clostridium fungisolvens]GFP78429.1 hypothetical protein bsdtw1_04653 [Clostridium fungisolvens]
MDLSKDRIRVLLIDSVHSKIDAKDFFEKNLNSGELLNILIEFAVDDYSGDARMEAAYWISRFETILLKNVEKDLLRIQEDELDSIACHILVALGKIKSKEGLKFLIEKRIEPEMYWESRALKYYFSDIL